MQKSVKMFEGIVDEISEVFLGTSCETITIGNPQDIHGGIYVEENPQEVPRKTLEEFLEKYMVDVLMYSWRNL